MWSSLSKQCPHTVSKKMYLLYKSRKILIMINIYNKNSGHIHKPFFTGYIQELMEVLFQQVFHDPAPYAEMMHSIPIPEPLSSQYDRPSMDEAVAEYLSRFSRGGVWTRRTSLLHQGTPGRCAAQHMRGWPPSLSCPGSPSTSWQSSCMPDADNVCRREI